MRNKDGCVYVDLLRALADQEKDWSDARLAQSAAITVRTLGRMKNGLQVQEAKARIVLKTLGIDRPSIYLSDEPWVTDSGVRRSQRKKSIGQWTLLDKPHGVKTETRYPCWVARAKHEIDERIGRVRCYELDKFPDDEVAYLRDVLLKRHALVCRKLEPSSYFPKYFDSGTSGHGVYWVADEFVEGVTLKEFVESNEFSLAQVPFIAKELAAALYELHTIDIVRRELTPDRVLVRDDKSIMLFDLELVKMRNSAASRPVDWSPSPFFAPELVSGDIDFRADFFSWAQIVLFCLTGRIPDKQKNEQLLQSLAIPKPVYSVLNACLENQRNMRHANSFGEISKVLKRWK